MSPEKKFSDEGIPAVTEEAMKQRGNGNGERRRYANGWSQKRKRRGRRKEKKGGGAIYSLGKLNGYCFSAGNVHACVQSWARMAAQNC